MFFFYNYLGDYMRTFYIFKIKKYLAILANNHPYLLYKTIENIYNLKESQVSEGIAKFRRIKDNFNEYTVNNNLFNYYKNKPSYTNFKNVHMINDFFSEERTKLIVNRTFLVIRTNEEIPTFLKTMKHNNNLFVCDFINKDYFWLNQIRG